MGRKIGSGPSSPVFGLTGVAATGIWSEISLANSCRKKENHGPSANMLPPLRRDPRNDNDNELEQWPTNPLATPLATHQAPAPTTLRPDA